MFKRFLALAACALLLPATTAFAQEITGAIVGTVTDTTGAVVRNASVAVTDTDKKTAVRTVNTGEDGTYSVPQLPVGNYEVAIEAGGFKKHVETGIKLDVNQRRNVDAQLEAGRLEEVVTVEAAPLQVETQLPTASTLISGEQVRELSINNRNFVQLVTLAPGVTNDLADQVYVGTVNPEGQANTVNISVTARAAARTRGSWTART